MNHRLNLAHVGYLVSVRDPNFHTLKKFILQWGLGYSASSLGCRLYNVPPEAVTALYLRYSTVEKIYDLPTLTAAQTSS